eukprot:CAMPEP_0184497622 /NCGR_PEP_ID=MMETSP0113_2-20130426/37023_1 /TAXON_ID=91329 /ORGANISM="Norrisiella sphaerica, Strain BC52" /LENGTH=553 /DNA_ID=CAMNT_0026884815 /DNA_START=126 /DNA_END=1787 /DNA_ORIENTATION=-
MNLTETSPMSSRVELHINTNAAPHTPSPPVPSPTSNPNPSPSTDPFPHPNPNGSYDLQITLNRTAKPSLDKNARIPTPPHNSSTSPVGERVLPGAGRARSYWPEGESWDEELGNPRNNYHIAVINVWLGRSLPQHAIQSLHTFSRNRNASTYLLFTDPSYISGLSDQLKGIPGVQVISSFLVDGRSVGLKEYIHHQFWRNTKEVTKEEKPFEFDLGHNLCDYRPLYGLLFQEYLRDYSHWAWVDKDTFVADLSLWISSNDLLAAEVIGIGGTKNNGKIMVSTYGQLAIFHNTERVNRLMLLDPRLLISQFKRPDTSSANTDEYHFNRLALAGAGRDKLNPPLNIMYIVHSTRKRHGTLVEWPTKRSYARTTEPFPSPSLPPPPPSDPDLSIPAVPYTMIETSTCFTSKPEIVGDPASGGTPGFANPPGVCRMPDDVEAKHAMNFYRATFEEFKGGTQKLAKGEIDCCGWWMGKHLSEANSGWFKFYRDNNGNWWKRRALRREDVKLINTTKGEVIQWKSVMWAHVRTEMCVIQGAEQETWLPVGHECAQGKIK